MKEKENFFKAKVFQLIAKELDRRYYNTGGFGKTIGKQKFKQAKMQPLQSLLGYTDSQWMKKNSISVEEFAQALKNSAVAWSVSDFVSFHFKRPMVLKSDVEKAQQQKFQKFLAELNEISPVYQQVLCSQQLQNWCEQELPLVIFEQTAVALNNLPQEYMRLPVFAYQQTGNPHAFDEQQAAGRLLLQVLTARWEHKASKTELAFVEQKNQILSENYLLRDDIKNDVAARGLTGKIAGNINQMWYQACLLDCTWNIPLKEILRMESVSSLRGNKVLLVENSGVYSILVDLLPGLPIICSSGQFKYAVWQLLRKLAASNCQLYYVGDMDPEGLNMAQNLLNIFPECTQTIGMNLENFEQASQLTQISETRMKQLRLISDSQLKEIAKKIQETNQTAMQEGFIQNLIQEIKAVFEME